MEDQEGRIRELSDEIKWNNIHITGFPEETEGRLNESEGKICGKGGEKKIEKN